MLFETILNSIIYPLVDNDAMLLKKLGNHVAIECAVPKCSNGIPLMFEVGLEERFRLMSKPKQIRSLDRER